MAEKKRKKKPASLGCVFWIAFILLIIVLFFFNKKNIGNVLEKTGARDILSGKKPVAEKTLDGSKDGATAVNPETTIATNGSADADEQTGAKAGDGSKETEGTKPAAGNDAPAGVKTETAKEDGKATGESAKKAPTPEKPKAVEKSAPKTVTTSKTTAKPATEKVAPTRKATLYFVSIDPDGRVVRKEVAREIPVSDSPLTDALRALLKGPTAQETAKGYRSLIPAGTRVLSVLVRSGVATVNVSEEFQFNQYGIEGYIGQLSEIVFTATAFSTVTSVQFLIEGQKREYLGAEGVWIGTPLSRDKFQ
jgi:spore germination protein GerM